MAAPPPEKRARVAPATAREELVARLRRAAEGSDLKTLRALLEDDSTLVNETWDAPHGARRHTVLLEAALQGDHVMAELALQHGANINHRHVYSENPDLNEGWTPLMLSTAHGFALVAELLLRRGAEIHPQERRCIAQACSRIAAARIRRALDAEQAARKRRSLAAFLAPQGPFRALPVELVSMLTEFVF